MAVISTSFIPFAADEPAFSVTVTAVVPPLLNVADDGTVHVIPEAAVQFRLTVPAKPFTEDTWIWSVAAVPAWTATVVVAGVRAKSESGLAMLAVADEEA